MAYLLRIFFAYFALLTMAVAIGAGVTSYEFVSGVGIPLDKSTSALLVIIAGYVAAIPVTLLHVVAEYIAEMLD